MCVTESGRVIRQQCDFGMTYVALSVFPVRTNLSGCPDGLSGRSARYAPLFFLLHTLAFSFTLAHRVRPFLLASARHEDLVQAAGWTPLSRHIPARRGGSTGPRPRTSTAAEPRGRLDIPHQRYPGIARKATLQSPVPVPRAPPREAGGSTESSTLRSSSRNSRAGPRRPHRPTMGALRFAC